MASDKPQRSPSRAERKDVYSSQNGFQCRANVATRVSPRVRRSTKAPAVKENQVINIEKYLADCVQSLSFQLKEIENTISMLMNRFIREKDHTVARYIQREIDCLDEEHARIHDRLREEKRRHQRYAAAS